MSEDTAIDAPEEVATPEVTAEATPEATPEVTTDVAESPEWLQSKYLTDGKSQEESIAEQAKAYNELSGKFGSFTGSPEAYEVTLSEELTEAGFEINADDPLVESAMQFAKDSNMSQEGFNGMVELYAMQQLAEAKADQEYREGQLKALGANADSRVKNVNEWVHKNLDPELVGGLEQTLTTAESVKAIEKLISMTKGGSVDVDNSTPASYASMEEVQKMQFEKDSNGNRRINTDPAFKKQYQEKRDQVYGTNENRTMVG